LSGLKFHYEQLGKGYAHGRSGVGTRKSPTDDDSVRRVLRGIIRKHGKAPPKKLALLLDSIEKIMDLQPPNLKGLRNKALISLTWAACRRVSEVCALNIQRSGDGWIEFDDHGLVVVLRRSKANQDFRIEERYGVPTRKSAPRYCPVVLVRQWIEAAGIRSGPVFPRILRNGKPRGQQRLQGQGLWKMLKSAAAKIGLNPDDVSTHSLRAGCITWLYLEGVHPERIREQSGHKDLETLFKYIRPLKRSATSPLADTRWVK
jgi:integrase